MANLRRLLTLGVLSLLAAGGGYLFWLVQSGAVVDQLWQVPRKESSQHVQDVPVTMPTAAAGDLRPLRIGVFYPGAIEPRRLDDPNFAKILTTAIHQCDLMVVHGFRGPGRAPFLPFFESLREEGRPYRYLVPVPFRDMSVRQFCVLFYDESTLIMDRRRSGPIEDPARAFRWTPLVASFAGAGVPLEQTFTFTVVAARVDPLRVSEELELLSALLKTVAYQQGPEDDILLLAHLEVDEDTVLRFFRDRVPAVVGIPNSSRGTRLLTNILLDPRGTTEFTGRSGVIAYETLLGDKQAPSSTEILFLPVWAEFSRFEATPAESFTHRWIFPPVFR